MSSSMFRPNLFVAALLALGCPASRSSAETAVTVDFFEGFDGPTELVLHVCGETNYRADGRFERTAA